MPGAFRVSGGRVAGQVDGVGDVNLVALDAELVRGDAAEHVLRHQAVRARVRARGNRQRDPLPVFLDREVVAVGGEHGGDVGHALGVIHCFFSTTGTDVPDHSPKILTTIDIAAFFAPATTTGIEVGPARNLWNASSPSYSPRNPGRATSALPMLVSSAPVRPHRSRSHSWTSALDRPALANICACSGHSTRATEENGKICEPVRLMVSWMSRSTSSWLGVCRLSTNSMVRVSVAEAAEPPPLTPPFSANGSHGDSSSFSALQTCQRPGRALGGR